MIEANKPVTDKFVRHLNAGFFLSENEYEVFIADVSSLRWFQYHREGLGLESYLYTLMRIAK